MCADFKQILNVWPIDCGPTPDFQRSVGVCIVGVPAGHTEKLCLAFTISLIDRSALRASSRGVARIDEPNRDTRSLCLVQDKALQLVKRPTVQTTAPPFTNPYPDKDTTQILQSDPASGALCSTNYLLRNYVVRVANEALLFALSSPHQPLCAFRALLLQFAPKTNIASPVIVDGRSGESFSVRCVGNSHEAKVNADPLKSLILLLVWNVNGRKKKPFFVSVNQVSLAALEGKKFSVVVAANERDLLTTGQCPNTGKALIHVPRQDAEIVRDRTILSELSANLVVNLVGISNLGVESNDHLSRERKLISEGSVKRFMQIVLTKLFNLPCQFTETITSFIGHLQSAQKFIRLVGRWLKFNLRGQLDANPLSQYLKQCNYTRGHK
jgi:hypothetical protein